jgi:hypothetical protein
MTGMKTVKANATGAEEETASRIKTVTVFAMTGREQSDRKDATGEEEMKTSRNALRLFLIAVIGSAIIPSGTKAQFSLSTGLNMSYNDNINSNYELLSDEVTEFFFETAYDFPSKNKNFELYYEGSLNYYRRNISRTFHEHSVGMIYSTSFGKKLGSSFNTGASFLASINREDYTYLDYNNASAFVNFRTYTGKRTAWQIGYRFGYFNYSEISDFNNIQNYLYTSFTGYLPSRTTISIETGAGVKTYLNSLVSGTSGMGQGKHRIGSVTLVGESISRLDLSGKISKSIFDMTGISLSGGYSKVLNSDGRYLASGNVNGNDNVFDDEYSFEGPFVTSTLTQRFPWGIAAVLTGSYQYRVFVDRPAYDLLENVISDERTDDVFAASFQLVKDFKYFGIRFVYNYINNSSNDRYYNSENNIFSVEIGAGF